MIVHTFRNILLALYVGAMLSACTGLSQLKSFDDRAGYAAILISNITSTTTDRYKAGAISKNQAEKVVRVLKSAQDYLELANTAYEAGSLADAEQTLDYAIAVLTALERELEK